MSRTWLVLSTVLAAGVVGFALVNKSAPRFVEMARDKELPALGTIHNFELTRETGTSFASSDLKDKVWIASFMFTRCHGPCPLMSQKMAMLQKELADLPAIRLVSITVDPTHDTPPVLQEYAQKFAADPARWYFLTGEMSNIIQLATEAFKLPAGEDPDLHSTRFVLVDGQGRVRGYYDSTAPDSLAQLKKHAATLASQVVS